MLRNEKGSLELIVMGLLAALILVLAIPLLGNIGNETGRSLTNIRDQMKSGNDAAMGNTVPTTP